MSIIYGLTILMLAICSVTDIKRREISLPAAIAFLIAAILYRGYQGLWWQGFFELFMRFLQLTVATEGRAIVTTASGRSIMR